MKVAFFSEIGTSIGTHFKRSFQNARTDVAWAVSLNAGVLSFDTILKYNSQYQPYPDGITFDLGIVIVPKKDPRKAFDFFAENRDYCRKWAVMQEGPQWGWQDWEIHLQIEYINFLQEMDLLFCHNEIDWAYYSGLFPGKQVEILPSLMIEDSLVGLKTPDRSGVMIGGNWCSWYSGQDSYFIAQEFGEEIYAPSMGRKQDYEDYLEDIKYLPYLSWQDWIFELNKRKYAVHLMRTYAAGTFSLNCAYLGIPCIAYNSLDTQAICFPELSPDEGDLVEARKIAKHLKENKLFYNHCSAYAKKAYHDNFREEIFLENFKETIQNLK